MKFKGSIWSNAATRVSGGAPSEEICRARHATTQDKKTGDRGCNSVHGKRSRGLWKTSWLLAAIMVVLSLAAPVRGHAYARHGKEGDDRVGIFSTIVISEDHPAADVACMFWLGSGGWRCAWGHCGALQYGDGFGRADDLGRCCDAVFDPGARRRCAD